MTYEEAVADVLKVAGDYKKINSTHDIEVAICKKEISQLRDDIKNIVEKLSISPESIQLNVKDERIYVKAFGLEEDTWGSLYDTARLKNASTEFPNYVDRALRRFIKEYAIDSRLEIGDIQRFCGYARLIMSSITSETITALSEAGDKLDKAKSALFTMTDNYSKYCVDLKAAMNRAAQRWLPLIAVKPGMRLSIKDLRSSERESDVRTVKRVRNQDGEVVMAFEGTASIVRGTSRIDALESWLINNPQFLEIAKVIKDSRFQRLF